MSLFPCKQAPSRSCCGSVGFEWKPEQTCFVFFRVQVEPLCHCMLPGGGGRHYCTPFQRGWFQTILLNGAQWQFPCHLFIQTPSLISISLQFFIQQTRKRTMCISSCKSQLVMNLYLKSLQKSTTLLFNGVRHGNRLLQPALHCRKGYNYV